MGARVDFRDGGGRSVLITGASRGIGYCVAELFARRNYRVYANFCKTEETLPPLAADLAREGFFLMPVRGDVSRASDVERIFEKIGGADILINNAGISSFSDFLSISEDDWDEMLRVNLKSAFLCTKAALPRMLSGGFGRIVNISSVYGLDGGSCEAHYSAAKAGLIGMTKALARELGPSGITVNCVAPGVIETDMNACFDREEMGRLARGCALGRNGNAADVAGAVLFLVQSEFITGEVLRVDGGSAF